MILKRLSLACWRCILEQVVLGPFSEKINIIHAPNGTGKSSLFEALQRAVFDSHQVSGRLIEEIRPWGRDLAPRVTIEFVRDDVDYRFSKQFLLQPFARLERKEGGDFKPFKEGRQADEFVRSLFSDNLPGRGLSKPEHHGLCQVLWAPQGRMELDSVSPAVVGDIKQALGVQVSRSVGGPIEAEIEKRYNQYFTRTGKLRTGKNAPDLVRLKAEKKQLEEKLQSLAVRQQAFEQARLKVEDLQERRKRAVSQVEAIRQKLESARRRAEQYSQVKKELEGAIQRARAAEAQYQALAEKINQVDAASVEAGQLGQEIEQIEAKLAAAAKESKLRAQEFELKKARLNGLEVQKRKVERLRRKVEQAQHFIRVRRQLDKLSKRLKEIEKCEELLQRARQERSAVLAPDRKILQQVRRLSSRCEKIRGRIESSFLRLEIDPCRDLDVKVIKGEGDNDAKVHVGRPSIFKGPAEVVIELCGVARLRAWGPAADLDQQKRLLEQAEEELEKLTRAFGSCDPDKLQSLLDRAELIDSQVKGFEEKRRLLLEDGDEDLLRTKMADYNADLKNCLMEFADWKEALPQVDRLAEEYSEASQEYEKLFSDARAEFEQSREALEAARKKEDSLRDRLEGKKSEYSRACVRLEDLKKDGESQQNRRKKLDRLALEWSASRGPIPDLEKQLERFGPDPSEELKDLEVQLDAARKEERQLRDTEKTAEGQVAELSRQAPYTKLAACEERLAAIESRIDREQLRLQAIELLRSTVCQLRLEMTARVVQPLEQVATRLLERIGGPTVGRVGLDENLKPAFVEPALARQQVGLENLSGGESEQLHFVCRLALAEILARDQRQLLVLDDVLTATDAGRLGRILRILKEMQQKLQIIILTCHPQRYTALGDVAGFDLEKLLA